MGVQQLLVFMAAAQSGSEHYSETDVLGAQLNAGHGHLYCSI